MHHSIEDEIVGLGERLASARAEEAEALRRAHRLRAVGTLVEFKDAMRDVDASHGHVVDLQRQVGWSKAH